MCIAGRQLRSDGRVLIQTIRKEDMARRRRDSPSRALLVSSTSLRIAVDVVCWLSPDFVFV
jgi:hypothetical protein